MEVPEPAPKALAVRVADPLIGPFHRATERDTLVALTLPQARWLQAVLSLEGVRCALRPW